MPGSALVSGLPAPMIIDRSLADVARVREATGSPARRSRAFRPPSARAQVGISPSPDAGAERLGNGPGPTLRE
jgi:hypothetical protein